MRIKLVAFLAVCILFLCVFVSCNDNAPLELMKDGESNIVIIRSFNADESIAYASEIYSFVKSIDGFSDVKLYGDIRDENKEKIEILVGNTNRKETKQVTDNLKTDDFAIVAKGNKLVIAGGSDEATLNAVDYFKNNYEKVLKSGVFTSADSYEYFGEYKITDAKISNVDLSDYVIVYPDSTGIYAEVPTLESEFAEKLSNYFADEFKINVPYQSDTSEKSEHEIIIGNTNRDNKEAVNSISNVYGSWVLKSDSDSLTIYAQSLWGYNRALDSLNDYIKDKKFDISKGTYVNNDTGLVAEEKNFVYVTKKGLSGDNPVKKILINGNDISKYTIIFHDYEKEEFFDQYRLNEVTAASELSKYIECACGIKLECKDDTTPSGDYEIVIGSTSRGVPCDDDLGEEAFIIQTVGNTLYIYGGHIRGTIYGVYEFLKEYIGCRFFASDCEIIYQSDEINIPDGLFDKQSSDLYYRDIFSHDSTITVDFPAKTKINGYLLRGASYDYGYLTTFVDGSSMFVHTMTKSFHIGENEYTQPCFTDEENIQSTIRQTKDYLASDTRAKIISISQNDNNNYCKCSKCSKINREEGSDAGALIYFINRVADAIKDEYPDVKILTLAYMFSVKAPKTAPRDNVIIELCAFEYCETHPFGECVGNEEFFEQIKAWRELTDNLFIWDYVVDFGKNYEFTPFMNFDALYGNYKIYRENGVIGTFNEGQVGGFSPEFGELRAYLLSELMWNSDLTKEEYEQDIKEFISAYYGPGSQFVQDYFDYLREISPTSHFNLWTSPDGVFDKVKFNCVKKDLARMLNKANEISEADYYSKRHTFNLKEGFSELYQYFSD